LRRKANDLQSGVTRYLVRSRDSDQREGAIKKKVNMGSFAKFSVTYTGQESEERTSRKTKGAVGRGREDPIINKDSLRQKGLGGGGHSKAKKGKLQAIPKEGHGVRLATVGTSYG